MGYRVTAVVVADDKLRLARSWARAGRQRPREERAGAAGQIGGVHGAIVTAVAPQAFRQAIAMLRPQAVCYIGPAARTRSAHSIAARQLQLGARLNVGTRLDERSCRLRRNLVTAKIKNAGTDLAIAATCARARFWGGWY
jgi:propanol-preferring alcohol dehydrogenase